MFSCIIKNMLCRAGCVLLYAVVIISSVNNDSIAAQQPNIVYIMADDLGWNHLGNVNEHPKGSSVPTEHFYSSPNIDRLAREGVTFRHSYMQPNCQPTRAALATGQYPARINNDIYVVGNLNRGGMNRMFLGPEQSVDVNPSAVTAAEMLKKNGYTTAHIGKYHVGGHSGPETLPENQGFDINIGGCKDGHQAVCFASRGPAGRWRFKGVGRGDFNGWAKPYTRKYVNRRNLPESLIGTPKHICDAVGDAAEETLQYLSGQEKPFFLEVHTYAVHSPVRGRPDLVARFRSIIAESEFESPAGAEYLAFIAGFDEIVGRIVAKLDDPDGDGSTSDSIRANTVIIVTSDNGGTHASNDPLLGCKGMFTEGGIRVPMVVSWKGRTATGVVSDRPVHAVDYYPTYCDLAGNRWLPDRNTHPLDGFSFASLISGSGESGSEVRPEPIFYLFPGYLDTRAEPCCVAIDQLNGNRLKIMYYFESDSWELYNLTSDPGETDNCLSRMPAAAEVMSEKLVKWLTRKEPTWQPKAPLNRQTGQPIPFPTGTVNNSAGG